ncbi:histidine ammonia-lyase, partial [Jiangella aurantiaca]
MKEQRVVVGTGPVSFDEIVAVARGGAGVELGADARVAVARSREVIEKLAVADLPYYGVSTGFGALATRHIPAERRAGL